MKRRIAILGSCVTRDAIKVIKESVNIDIDFYAARSSIASIYSGDPINCDDSDVLSPGIGLFEQKMILWDLRKTVKELIRQKNYDYLILDCIDERFNLCTFDKKIFTLSNYMQNSSFYKKMSNQTTIIYRNSDESLQLWRQAVDSFSQDVQDVNIIVHQAYWATHFYNYDTNTIEKFNTSQIEYVTENNARLNNYYSYLKKMLPKITLVTVDKELAFSDFAHKWGKDYFHYGKDYYNQLSAIISNIVDK